MQKWLKNVINFESQICNATANKLSDSNEYNSDNEEYHLYYNIHILHKLMQKIV